MQHNKTDFAYQKVYRYLSRLTNELPQGPAVKLPSLRLLARRLRVSISTVQNAYALLEKEGRICSVPKSGYYALPQPSNDIQCEGEGLLERYQASARRPDMFVFGADEPTLLQSLDSTLLSVERDLMRHYPCQPDPRFQPFGDIELRTALAAHYTSSTASCWHPDNVFMGPDKTGVLKTVLNALQLRDCAVLVETPCGWSLLRTLQSFGIRVIEWENPADGEVDTDALDALLTGHDVKMVILASRMTPLRGRARSQAALEQVAQVLNRRVVWVVEDDSHGGLCEPDHGAPLRDLIDPQRLLILGAFDKTIGLEAPFGYLLSRHSRSLWHQQLLLRSFRLPPIRQKAIARLFGSGQLGQHLQGLRAALDERMHRLTALVSHFLGEEVGFLQPQGGATLWLDCQSRVDMARVFERLLEQRIVIAPGELFSVRGLHRQSLCLSVAADWGHDIESTLVIVKNALAQERIP
ncbi:MULTISPECIES: aminotransferase class I/II-fold pyridoxal phosphate-dependent enzyme [unclassified Pseudomonas]|uniref:aminotransferase class I/II-fold pyridoxal phosphate-dependent enzyme n=1 Tax=unclassified Pseudomonas TaxID=196821 RepID=UPI000D364282|nr:MULTISPECIES: aminotransferase class I/II-fold pyridoxal phosphate-dependent enzyme [unclassified Pseudomonas]RAU42167.1 GntR family transcriptional regulator [Pseudomonas sp. RIT 409]RAU49746.1 GntR family transcriptional regulator [Pseudomonas sp. RIT 412]